MLPSQSVERVFEGEEVTAINIALRDVLGRILTSEDRAKAATAALWIVRNWGGIKRGVDQIPIWSAVLGDFSELRIEAFVEARGTARISSWSKLLAFAKPAQHAIYDARTAVALNCVLAQLGDNRRFHMPASQNRKINAARGYLIREPTEEARGYPDYIRLLDSVVASGLADGILQAEMNIFANAPLIASMFGRQRELS